MSSPPPFSHTDPGPPAYETESGTYKINGFKLPTLVPIPELKAHLLLLGAFHRLKAIVEEGEWFIFEKGSALPLMEAKWALFVERAVVRFGAWLQKGLRRQDRPKGHITLEELPPLDVALVLHAYCRFTYQRGSIRLITNFEVLNPYAFYEDAVRLHPEILEIGGFPLLQLVS
jgi:hypothetical protein